jgi:hypothetical protein
MVPKYRQRAVCFAPPGPAPVEIKSSGQGILLRQRSAGISLARISLLLFQVKMVIGSK